MVTLSYPVSDSRTTEIVRTVRTRANLRRTGAVRIAVVGAGSFARSTHLPNLKALDDRFEIAAVVSGTGHNAAAAARQFEAEYASTDFESILKNSDIDAVLIATRPRLHAGMALQALRSGKHVLVEKPLALEPSSSTRSGRSSPKTLARANLSW